MQDSFESGFTERLLPGGEGVVRTPSGVFLVPNTVPGDYLDIRIKERRRGACRGNLYRLNTPSVERVTDPTCSAAQSCGGCALQFVHAEYQAIIKNDWVSNAFSPYLSSQVQFNGISDKEVMLGSRRRVRWWRGEDPEGVFWGFRSRASHDVSRHVDCIVATPRIRQLHLQISDLSLPSVKSLQVTELSDGIHLVLEGECADSLPGLPETISGKPVQSWFRTSEQSITPLTRPVLDLHDRLPAGEDWLDLSIGPNDFIQASKLGNELMIHQVQAWSVSASRVADLFSGNGNLSLPLAASMDATVLGAEVRQASVTVANATARRLGLNAQYMNADLFHAFDLAPFTGADVLILDPPRKGARHVCKELPVLLPRKIILISCDIASGKRDAEMIAQHGYHLREIRALDMFSFTGHVEAMSLWEL